MSEQKKIYGGLWKPQRESKLLLSGGFKGEYLGKLLDLIQEIHDDGGELRMAVFKNDRKESDRHPDINIIFQESERRDLDDPAAPTGDSDIPW